MMLSAAFRAIRLTRLGLLLTLTAGATQAATVRMSPSELAALLPAYCADSELSTEYVRYGPRWQYWTARMGGNFNRIHHYCQGLLHAQNARKEPPGSQAYTVTMKLALMEFNYMLDGEPIERLRAFPLWPELLMRRGEAAAALKNWPLAYSSFEESRRVKPDYWPAYHGWAELLLKINMKAEAKDILLQGLRHTPQVEPMRQLYMKLGGKLSDIPEPPAAPTESPGAAASAAEAASAPAEAASTPSP